MFTVDLRVDGTDQIEKKLGAMREKAGIVMARAANSAATTAKKVIKQETAKKYMVQQKDIENIARVQKAFYGRPYAVVKFCDGHKNLAHWPMKSRNLSPYKRIHFNSKGKPNVKVYKAQVKREGGKKELGGDRKPFLQVVKKSGVFLLLRRKEGSHGKLEGVTGPAFTQIVQNKDVMERCEKEAMETLRKRIGHETDHILGKRKGK